MEKNITLNDSEYKFIEKYELFKIYQELENDKPVNNSWLIHYEGMNDIIIYPYNEITLELLKEHLNNKMKTNRFDFTCFQGDEFLVHIGGNLQI